MRVIILLALVGAALARSAIPGALPRQHERIVGGSPTTVETYPYISNMQYLVWGVFWSTSCGGSLITTRTILSAAHCYSGDSPSSWRVRLGSTFSSSGGTIHNVNSFTIHESYNRPGSLENDVAIVHLATPATISASVQLARIAGPNYIVPAGTVTTTLGWGTLSVTSLCGY
uniref:Peptidase S1 domain-containing protein n=1 Tax=Pectinophora gossypiella TaxID=13191 RepID=A0A1E1WD40_PECGO